MRTSTALLELLPVAVYLTDTDGHLTFYNKAAAELWGLSPKLGDARWSGAWRLYRPDGRPLAHEECPMAECVKTGKPVRGVEVVAERPDGTRVPYCPHPTPITDKDGKIIGAVNLLVDLSDSKRAEMDSLRLAAIVASSDDAIISKTLEGRVTSWNAAATRLFGYEADEMVGQPILKLIPPELHQEEVHILEQLKRGQRIDHYDTIRVAKDGRRVNVSLTVSPLRDRAGNIVGASKIARDVTERKQSEALQRTLVDELNHRVKNTLATIQSIASQSLRHARNPNDFVSGFNGRIQALARAHNLLTQAQMQGSDLAELASEQVLSDLTDHRITISGPQLTLDPQTTVHLALILHELGTNARKYGALSNPRGRLSLSWEVRTGERRELYLSWHETGGPPASTPVENGFGTILVERTAKARGGSASIRYDSGGVAALVILPLPDPPKTHFESFAGPRSDHLGPLFNLPDSGAILKGKRCVVIEDEPLILMNLESSLTAAGCDVAGTAGTLEEAKELCLEGDYDFALVDVSLVGQSVESLAETLTQRGLPFAFVTGHGREALPHGYRDAILLKKPFSQGELTAVVELLVYQSRNVVPLRRASFTTGRAI